MTEDKDWNEQQQQPLQQAPLQTSSIPVLNVAAQQSEAAAVEGKHEPQETPAAPLAAAPPPPFGVGGMGGWGAGVLGNTTGTQFICFTTQFTCFTTQFTCFTRRWKGARPPVSASSFLKLSLFFSKRKHPPCLVLAYCPVQDAP